MATIITNRDAISGDGRASKSPMRGQISAFLAGALFIGIGLVMVYMVFIGPSSTPTIDPVAAWCRGWIDGLSYTDFRSGSDYEPATLDEAEEKCYSRYESGLRAPASRGPLTAEDSVEGHP